MQDKIETWSIKFQDSDKKEEREIVKKHLQAAFGSRADKAGVPSEVEYWEKGFYISVMKFPKSEIRGINYVESLPSADHMIYSVARWVELLNQGILR